MPETNGVPLSDVVCTVCGKPLPVQLGAGRPREMHAHCVQLGKVLAWLETSLVETAPYLDDAARERIRMRIDSALEYSLDEKYIGEKKWQEKVIGNHQ